MNIYNLEEYKNIKYEYDPYAEDLIRGFNVLFLTIGAFLISVILACRIKVLSVVKDINVYMHLFIVLLPYILLIILVIEFERIKIYENISPKALHDYNYYFYKKRKSKLLKNSYLIMMCKCNIQIHRYKEALMALELIDFNKLATGNKSNYLMCRAIISRLLENEEQFEECIYNYEVFFELNKKVAKPEKKINIIRDGSKEEIINIIDVNGETSLGRKSLKVIFYFWVFCSYLIIFSSRRVLFPIEIEFRSWLEIMGKIIVYGGALILPIAVIRFIKNAIKQYFGKVKPKKVVCVLGIIISISYISLIGASAYKQFKLQTFETKVSDEVIRVEEGCFFKEYVKYYCEPCTIFFRKSIFFTELKKFNDVNRESKDKTKISDKDEQKSFDECYSGDSLEAEYNKIYESEFKDAGDTIEISTSAKGRSYALIGPEKTKDIQGQAVKTSRRLVFDRESKNGKCDEFVYYEDQYSQDGTMVANTVILNFYAVVKSTGEVIKADKTKWEDVGNKAYKDATTR